MVARIARGSLGIFALLWILSPAQAGLYCTMDAPEETRLSQDYEGVFARVLVNLQKIANDDALVNSPMRQRCLLVEAVLPSGSLLKLKTVEEKLNYISALVRLDKLAANPEAIQRMHGWHDEHRNNFVLRSHIATALFSLPDSESHIQGATLLKQALRPSLWPTRPEDLKAEQKAFLKLIGWGDTELDRYHRCDSYLLRLMNHRVAEEAQKKQGIAVPVAIDPIFQVSFLTEQGTFEPGRIAEAEWKKLPKSAVEDVEQLLIWRPNDDRLLWLLGEVLNASAVEASKTTAEKNDAVRNARAVFAKIATLHNLKQDDPRKIRLDALNEAVAKMPDRFVLDPKKIGITTDKEDVATLTSQQWWRALGVGGVTGFAVGLFALWQVQEVRRRRQARVTSAN